MNAKSIPSFEFHLFVNAEPAGSAHIIEPSVASLLARRYDQSSTRGARPLILSSGIAALHWSAEGIASLAEASAAGAGTQPLLEPVDDGTPTPRLLIFTPGTLNPRVNGKPAPPLTILSDSDEFYFDSSSTFLVAVYHRPRLGPASDDIVGVTCSLCSLPLAAGDHCLICPCGAPIHAAPDQEHEQGLNCVKMASECSRCRRPYRLESGYDSLPHTPKE